MKKEIQESADYKEKLSKKLYEGNTSVIKRYVDFFVGDSGFIALIKYETITTLFGLLPGAIGLFLRKNFYPWLFKSVGTNVLWGRNIALRHPVNIELGNRVAVDDNCILDAKGAGEDGIKIGDDVVIARDTIIQGKRSFIEIGDRCIIGSQCQLSSAGGIRLGKCVGIAGQCYIGGGLYKTENTNIPMMDQGPYSNGPVIIEDDVWIGAGVKILDGVRVGKGSFVGAGAVIADDILPYTIAAPYQKIVKLPRTSPKETTVRKDIDVEKANNNSKIEISDVKNEGRVDSDKIVKIIFNAVDEINEQLPKDSRIEKSVDRILFVSKSESNIESLTLINLIVAVEQIIEEEFGVAINLADEQLVTQDENPFQSIGSLSDCIVLILNQKKNE